MTGLLVKEGRQLLPIAWLWLAVLAIAHATQFAIERFDEQSFGGWCEGYCDAGAHVFVAVFGIVFAMVTAYSLFPREHDESTIDFLRALPMPRWRIHLSKLLAGWLLLVGLNVLSYSLDALLLAANPESLGGRFFTQVWWTLLWRDCVFSFVILSHGVLLSWFRTTGLILYAIYVGVLIWVENSIGDPGLISVFGMLSNEYQGSRLVVDTPAIVTHVLVAIVLFWAGYRLWSRTESAAAGGQSSRRVGRWSGFLRGMLTVVAFLVLSGAALLQIGSHNGSLQEDEFSRVTTEHYRFVYRERDSDTVAYLQEHAESDLAKLGALLGVSELPQIRVDLTAASEHAAGLAKWKQIQMDLSKFDADVSQRRVLVHEAAHVLQAIESNRALSRHFATTQFFIEGMAQLVSFEIVPEQARRESNHALAAVAHARQNIRFSDLVDSAAFQQQYDPELYYSLGDLWTMALVDTCGHSVLGEFLRAAGRESASTRLSGELFWRDTFGFIGCDLDSVNAAWVQRMAVTLQSVDLSRFPKFDEVRVRRDEETAAIVIEARLVADEAGEEFIEPDRVVVRIRDAERLSVGVDPVVRGTIEHDDDRVFARFSIPLRRVPRLRVRYQLGYTPGIVEGDDRASDSRTLYDRWREGSVAGP